MSMQTKIYPEGVHEAVDEYSIKKYKHGIAVFGFVPLMDASNLISMWDSQGYKFLDAVIAERLKATFVLVQNKESSEAWKKELDIRFDHPDWIFSGDTGISSKTIYAILENKYYVLSGGSNDFDIPSDAEDFGRCYRLVKRYPSYESRLSEVAEKCPKWKPIVDNWKKLCESFEAEGKLDKDGFATANMYSFNNLLQEVCRK